MTTLYLPGNISLYCIKKILEVVKLNVYSTDIMGNKLSAILNFSKMKKPC